MPISALVTATLLDEEKLLRIRDAEANIVGVGLDAASEAVFERTRGRGARGPRTWEEFRDYPFRPTAEDLRMIRHATRAHELIG